MYKTVTLNKTGLNNQNAQTIRLDKIKRSNHILSLGGIV